jgi:AraC-like DNA-binding protein
MRTPVLGIEQICPSVALVTCHYFRRDIWFHYRVPFHHFLLVESGGIDAQTPYGACAAGPGDLLCFPPTDWNQYGARAETRYYEAHIMFAPPPRHREKPWLEGLGNLPLRLPMGTAAGQCRRLLETLCLEVGRLDARAALAIRAAVFELLSLIAATMSGGADLQREIDDWQRVEQRIMSMLDRELRVTDLAADFGLSAEHFIRQFKERFGQSPKAYHTRARMRKAAHLLRGGAHSVKEVAYTLGFADPKTFSRRFKSYLGTSPSELLHTPDSRTELPSARESRLLPLNRHILPPHTSPNWFADYLPRGGGQILRQHRATILAQISQPENLPQSHG